MKFGHSVISIVSIFMGLVPVSSVGDNLDDLEDDCARTAHSQIYSDAVFIEKAGDVVGFELAFQRHSATSTDALLYVYEGAPNKDGISLSGRISDRNVMMEGKWIEHLTEESSHKEVIETHAVKVDGTLDAAWFRGSIKIDGLTPSKIRLKRVNHVWMCKTAPKALVR
jgi:hypothetical protein